MSADRRSPQMLCRWLVKAGLSHSRSAAGLAAAIISGHSTGSSSYGSCTTESGHSMRSAGKLT